MGKADGHKTIWNSTWAKECPKEANDRNGQWEWEGDTLMVREKHAVVTLPERRN